MPTFVQAAIPIQDVEGYERLRSVFERLFGSEVETFLKAVQKSKLLIRDFEGVLASGAMEKSDRRLAQMGTTVRALYESLPLSDQAQVREFYLVRLEQVEEAIRRKFHRAYRLN
ncbi:MAG TPA: hypothetical protein VE734_11085 [Terriglobales bacterium]|jgi:hypothetical protein|nr:hypothetical protein [Terriglobales bacterium]